MEKIVILDEIREIEKALAELGEISGSTKTKVETTSTSSMAPHKIKAAKKRKAKRKRGGPR